MTGSDLIGETRILLADLAEPYLWSDDTLLAYIQEAERHFCARTHCLVRDGYSITTEANKSTYAVPSNALRVVFASINDVELPRGTAPTSSVYKSSSRGEPSIFTTGFPYKTIAFYPTPDDVYTVDLVLATLPSAPVESFSDPAVPPEYQHLLCDYAAYKALITNDVDGNNPGTGAVFEGRWSMGILEAKRDMYYYRTAPRVALRPWTGGKRNGY